MEQQKITRYFTKEIKTELNLMDNIKEEVNLDWNEKDHYYELPTARVLIERLDPKTIKNIIDRNRTNTKDSTLVNNNAKSHTIKVSKRSSNSKIRANAGVKKRKVNVEIPEETKECPKCKKPYKMQTYDWHVYYCGKERKFKCPHCPYKTKYNKCLVAHVSGIHPKGGDARASREFRRTEIQRYCQKCEKTFEGIRITSCEVCHSKLIFKCTVCNKITNDRQNANYHWTTRCGVKGYYHCHSCDYKAVFRSSVVKHSKLMHPDSSETIQWRGLFKDGTSSLFKCPKCAKHVSNRRKLEVHTRFCTAEGNEENVPDDDGTADPNKCSTCGKKFQHIYLLNKHTASCKRNQHVGIRISKDSDEEIIDVVADHPPVALISADEIRTDLKGMAVVYCHKCEVESDIERTWWKSELRQNEQCDRCKTALVIRCKKCLKEFSLKKTVMSHLKYVCFPEDEFKCSKCNFKASSVFRVREHIRSVHEVVGTECKKCGKTCKNPKYLYLHLRHCGKEPKLQCDHCPYKSKFKRGLQIHIFHKHMEAKVVDRSDTLKISAQRFSQTVTHLRAFCSKCKDEKRLHDRLKICGKCKTKLYYKCKTCKKRYDVDDENACDHVKAYLNMIKFECKRCGRGSMSKSSYNMHKSRCGAKFPCRFCKYFSNVRGRTTKHEKMYHPDEV